MEIAFIGGGNMATALIGGLTGSMQGSVMIRVSDPSEEVRNRLSESPGVSCFAEPAPAVTGADAIILAVKPQVMPVVLDGLSPLVTTKQLVISVAAGITIAAIQAALGNDVAVVRTMPNTPALLGYGMTGMCANQACTEAQASMAENIMGAVGTSVWVDAEPLMDVVTAVSGSGPAYFYLLAEAMRDAGARLGLPAHVATELARHTALGAGVMAGSSELDVTELRRRVTSPGGTTQAAIETLQAGGFEALVDSAVEAATRRGRALAEPAK